MAVVVIILLAALLGGMYSWDRKAKKRGHVLRSSSDMTRSERDVHRNIRASDATMGGPQAGWDKPDDQRRPGRST